MTVADASAAPDQGEARHASWLELFFDLIAVAGVGQLARLLRGSPSLSDIGLYLLLFLAFWTAWMLFTLYGNVAGETVRAGTVFVGMFGMAVMAAAVPGVREDKALAFALAYILVRLLASRAWRRRGEVLADMPIAQLGLGLAPWIVSLWIGGSARYVLWAIGLAADLGMMLLVSRTRTAATAERMRSDPERRGAAKGAYPVLVHTRAVHLDERLGLFLLIVLGEAIMLVVNAAAGVPWDRALYGLGVGSFFLLMQFWRLSLTHGYDGVPLLRPGVLPVRIALPLHCCVTASVAALAAALGTSVDHTHGTVSPSVRWLLCGSVAGYLAIAGGAAIASGRPVRWTLLTTAVPVAAVVAVGAVAEDWPPVAIVWNLVLFTHWTLRRTRRTAAGGPPEQSH